jgi:hypothetical protein
MTGPFFKDLSFKCNSYFDDVGGRPTSKARIYLLIMLEVIGNLERHDAYLIASHSENCSASFKSYWVYVVFGLRFFFEASPFFLFFCGFWPLALLFFAVAYGAKNRGWKPGGNGTSPTRRFDEMQNLLN